MAEEAEARTHRWVLPLIVGIFCGGLGGSIFTWYVNRPKPTVVTYRIATTTLSAPEAVGLIPGLQVLIAGKSIQALYAHNIELLPREGPFVEQAEVAFSFSYPVRVYGIHSESPSILHHLECGGIASNSKRIQLPDATVEISAVQCVMKPIFFQASDTHPFRITIATDSSEIPRVLMAARNIEITPADQFSPKRVISLSAFWTLLSILSALFSLSLTMFFLTGERRTADRMRVEEAKMLAKKLDEISRELNQPPFKGT